MTSRASRRRGSRAWPQAIRLDVPDKTTLMLRLGKCDSMTRLKSIRELGKGAVTSAKHWVTMGGIDHSSKGLHDEGGGGL